MEGKNNYPDMDSFNKDSLNKDSVSKELVSKQEKKTRRGYFYSGLVVGMLCSLMILSTVYFGRQLQVYFSQQKQMQEVGGQQEEKENISQNGAENSIVTLDMITKLQSMEALIKNNYYKDDYEKEDLSDGIYSGMMRALKDPYSVYYTAEELEQLMQETQGIYYGIGAGVKQEPNTLLAQISKVYPNTPAQEAGLQENDLLYEVNGQSTYNVQISEVVTWIKGAEGSKVKLMVIREGEEDVLEIEVERRKVEFPIVSFKMLDNEVAYIQIEEFDDVTPNQFADALAMARGNQMKGLVLDLRGNPGGSLTAVVEVAEMLLPKGMIVYTEDKYGKRTEYKGEGDRVLEVPMTVLIDGNSASASEILAGAIKDYEIGTLVGTTSFGKGIVQSVIPMKDGSAVKITVSCYYTPKGNNIHGIGIEPDVICEFDGEAYYGSEDHPDNQLDKALEVVKEKIAQAN